MPASLTIAAASGFAFSRQRLVRLIEKIDGEEGLASATRKQTVAALEWRCARESDTAENIPALSLPQREETDRARQALFIHGAKWLSTAELLTCENVLAEYGEVSFFHQQLKQVAAKASTIAADVSRDLARDLERRGGPKGLDASELATPLAAFLESPTHDQAGSVAALQGQLLNAFFTLLPPAVSMDQAAWRLLLLKLQYHVRLCLGSAECQLMDEVFEVLTAAIPRLSFIAAWRREAEPILDERANEVAAMIALDAAPNSAARMRILSEASTDLFRPLIERVTSMDNQPIIDRLAETFERSSLDWLRQTVDHYRAAVEIGEQIGEYVAGHESTIQAMAEDLSQGLHGSKAAEDMRLLLDELLLRLAQVSGNFQSTRAAKIAFLEQVIVLCGLEPDEDSWRKLPQISASLLNRLPDLPASVKKYLPILMNGLAKFASSISGVSATRVMTLTEETANRENLSEKITHLMNAWAVASVLQHRRGRSSSQVSGLLDWLRVMKLDSEKARLFRTRLNDFLAAWPEGEANGIDLSRAETFETALSAANLLANVAEIGADTSARVFAALPEYAERVGEAGQESCARDNGLMLSELASILRTEHEQPAEALSEWWHATVSDYLVTRPDKLFHANLTSLWEALHAHLAEAEARLVFAVIEEMYRENLGVECLLARVPSSLSPLAGLGRSVFSAQNAEQLEQLRENLEEIRQIPLSTGERLSEDLYRALLHFSEEWLRTGMPQAAAAATASELNKILAERPTAEVDLEIKQFAVRLAQRSTHFSFIQSLDAMNDAVAAVALANLFDEHQQEIAQNFSAGVVHFYSEPFGDKTVDASKCQRDVQMLLRVCSRQLRQGTAELSWFGILRFLFELVLPYVTYREEIWSLLARSIEKTTAQHGDDTECYAAARWGSTLEKIGGALAEVAPLCQQVYADTDYVFSPRQEEEAGMRDLCALALMWQCFPRDMVEKVLPWIVLSSRPASLWQSLNQDREGEQLRETSIISDETVKELFGRIAQLSRQSGPLTQLAALSPVAAARFLLTSEEARLLWHLDGLSAQLGSKEEGKNLADTQSWLREHGYAELDENQLEHDAQTLVALVQGISETGNNFLRDELAGISIRLIAEAGRPDSIPQDAWASAQRALRWLGSLAFDGEGVEALEERLETLVDLAPTSDLNRWRSLVRALRRGFSRLAASAYLSENRDALVENLVAKSPHQASRGVSDAEGFCNNDQLSLSYHYLLRRLQFALTDDAVGAPSLFSSDTPIDQVRFDPVTVSAAHANLSAGLTEMLPPRLLSAVQPGLSSAMLPAYAPGPRSANSQAADELENGFNALAALREPVQNHLRITLEDSAAAEGASNAFLVIGETLICELNRHGDIDWAWQRMSTEVDAILPMIPAENLLNAFDGAILHIGKLLQPNEAAFWHYLMLVCQDVIRQTALGRFLFTQADSIAARTSEQICPNDEARQAKCRRDQAIVLRDLGEQLRRNSPDQAMLNAGANLVANVLPNLKHSPGELAQTWQRHEAEVIAQISPALRGVTLWAFGWLQRLSRSAAAWREDARELLTSEKLPTLQRPRAEHHLLAGVLTAAAAPEDERVNRDSLCELLAEASLLVKEKPLADVDGWLSEVRKSSLIRFSKTIPSTLQKLQASLHKPVQGKDGLLAFCERRPHQYNSAALWRLGQQFEVRRQGAATDLARRELWKAPESSEIRQFQQNYLYLVRLDTQFHVSPPEEKRGLFGRRGNRKNLAEIWQDETLNRETALLLRNLALRDYLQPNQITQAALGFWMSSPGATRRHQEDDRWQGHAHITAISESLQGSFSLSEPLRQQLSLLPESWQRWSLAEKLAADGSQPAQLLAATIFGFRGHEDAPTYSNNGGSVDFLGICQNHTELTDAQRQLLQRYQGEFELLNQPV